VNGSLFLNGNEILSSSIQIALEDINELVYVPDPDYNGSDQFNWNASDGLDFATEGATITMVINPANDAPVDILLSNQTIEEGLPAGSLIGTLSVVDVDLLDSHTFELVDDNAGDAGNFTIQDDLLLTFTELDFDENEHYDIIIRVIDAEGSIFEKSFRITVIDVEELIFQTAITPNGDGFNDSWKIPQLNDCDECLVEIYDRWGKNVFSSIGYEQEWNGVRSGSPLPSGTYYYVIDFKNGDVPKTGAISLLR
jgi:gliding motility-associated-like protein